MKVKTKPQESSWSDKVVCIKPIDYGSWLSGTEGVLSYKASGSKNVWNYLESWSCRDSFHVLAYKRTNFLFNCSNASNAKKVAELVGRVESHLNLPFRTVMGMTNRLNYMWIRTNRWWTYCAVRRSFFTAMLRAGLKYKSDDSILENLFGVWYFSSTPDATKMFLNGRTKFKCKTVPRSRRGWNDIFYYGDFIRPHVGDNVTLARPVQKELLEELLVKP